MNGNVAGIAAIIGAVAATFHYFGWVPRFVSGLVVLVAAGLMIALSGVMGSVWSFTGHGAGMVLLITLAAVSAVATYAMVVKDHKHHPTRAAAAGAVFGISLVLIIGGRVALANRAVAGFKGAGTALSQIGSGNAGARAAAVTGRSGPGGNLALYGFGLAVLLLVAAYARTHGKGSRRGRPGGRGNRALPGADQ